MYLEVCFSPCCSLTLKMNGIFFEKSVSRTDLFEFQSGIHFYFVYKIFEGSFMMKILIQLNYFSVKNNNFSDTSVNFF